MKRIITTLFIAVLLSATSLSAQNVVPTYVIDGQKIENFDGSQLLGKTIVSYAISKEKNIHYVFTTDNKGNNTSPYKVETLETDVIATAENEVGSIDKKEIVYVIDGKVASPEQFKSITTPNIEYIRILKSKNGSDFKKYATANTEVVMMITTKK